MDKRANNRQLTVALLATLLGLGGAGTAFARWGVGNGGDDLRLQFEKARQNAAMITLKLQDRTLPMSLAPNVRDWLIANHQALSADIALSNHAWVLDAEQTCAWTQTTAGADIQLSYPTCRDGVASFDDAETLLIHESVHHFGVTDEQFADNVALGVLDAWRAGALEWAPMTQTAAPPPAAQSSAVWTGKQMIVYGGLGADNTPTNGGYAYDPVADTWAALSTAGAPARYQHQAVWTGRYMIVWGGYVPHANVKAWQNSGAVWDSTTDTWTPIASPYGPAELNDLSIDQRSIQTLVWTGTEAIVYGGAPIKGALNAGIYNPATNSWRRMSPLGAPLRTTGHSAVWADDRMIVFGGLDLGRSDTGTGASYDPVSNSWTPLATDGAPGPRDGHAAVWTGKQMIVFGGMDSVPDFIGTGGVYTPATDSWTPIRTESVQARVSHTAVWDGSEMLVFGGKSKKLQHTYFNAVSAYNPTSNTWRIVEEASAPLARCLHAAVWTGNAMVVYGGLGQGDVMQASGALFYP